MDFVVERKIGAGKYVYKIIGNDCFYGESNYTFGMGLRRLTVFDSSGKIICVLKQTNWLFKMITWIPLFWLLPIGQFPKYKYYDESRKDRGETTYSFFTPKRIIMINGKLYEIFLHSNNYISVIKNEIQIALIKKDDWTIGERNRYLVTFDEHLESDMALLLLFAIFTDIIFYPNRFRVDYMKYEKTIGPEKLRHRTLWKP